MYIRNSMKYGKQIRIIHPGEFYVSSQDEIIGTLLGSCVAVCLVDEKNGVSGMNHFMLPGRISNNDIFSDRSARYGITAINQLFTGMEQKGAVKRNLIAKLFGGGHVLESSDLSSNIPHDNIRLARIMMEIEDIHVTHNDLGENFTRKLLLDVKSGKVYLKKTTRKDVIEEIGRREIEYVKRSVADAQN